MNKINFQEMNRKTLKLYVLAYREDEEAFCAYIDGLHSESKWINMLAMSSVEDLEQHPTFLRKVSKKSI
jgi:hypothetical protein